MNRENKIAYDNLRIIKDFTNRVLSVVYDSPKYITKIYTSNTKCIISSLRNKEVVDNKGMVLKYFSDGKLKIEGRESEYTHLLGRVLESMGAGVSEPMSFYGYYCNIYLNGMVNKINSLKDYSDEELKLYFKLI